MEITVSYGALIITLDIIKVYISMKLILFHNKRYNMYTLIGLESVHEHKSKCMGKLQQGHSNRQQYHTGFCYHSTFTFSHQYSDWQMQKSTKFLVTKKRSLNCALFCCRAVRKQLEQLGSS